MAARASAHVARSGSTSRLLRKGSRRALQEDRTVVGRAPPAKATMALCGAREAEMRAKAGASRAGASRVAAAAICGLHNLHNTPVGIHCIQRTMLKKESR